MNRRRRPALYALGAAALLFLSGTLFMDGDLSDNIKNRLVSSTNRQSSSDQPRQSDLCTPSQAATGQWVRKPLGSLDAIREAYGLSSRARVGCPASPGIGNETVRSLEVASWAWEPSDACKVSGWTIEKLMIRALRSRQSMVFVGDSLTHQLFDLLKEYVNFDDSPYTTNHIGLIHSNIWLNPDHPDTPRLLRMANVPASRLRLPLATYWRHHHLLSVDELQQIFRGDDKYHFWGDPREPDWWPLYLIQRAEAYSIPTDVSVPGYTDPAAPSWERDVVVLNVGPHWTANELSSGVGMPAENLVKGYERMVDFVTTRFEALQPETNVYWRAIAPGHIDCEQYTTAEPWRTTIFSPKDPEKGNYNWELFEGMNNLIKARVKDDPARPPINLSSRSAANYLDIWSPSIQRPETHLNPGGDCLHYCSIGVNTNWLQLTWQSIIYDSLYQDLS